MYAIRSYYALFISEKNIELFKKHGIFSAHEVHSRYEILLENYVKTINIEALTMIEMVRKDILPAVVCYIKELSTTAATAKSISASVDCEFEVVITSYSIHYTKLYDDTWC